MPRHRPQALRDWSIVANIRPMSLIKSKKRIADHGEVFTPLWMVEAMLDLVKGESERIDSRFLEPACGSGNFLANVLQRKLAAVELNMAAVGVPVPAVPLRNGKLELRYGWAVRKGFKSGRRVESEAINKYLDCDARGASAGDRDQAQARASTR
jgi:hypothetical protein